MKYIPSINKSIRISSSEVKIGDLPLGGKNPIRIQSMTNTDTNNIEKSLAQCIELYNAGFDYVRLTTQGIREVESMIKIQDELRKRKMILPLIADVHFNPKVAELAAQHVAKVRINPGNYSEKRKGKIDFTDKEYQEELNKIKLNLLPLLKICKENKTALRIGINHGSLSERIMSKYGDTPDGMVESAMEFLRICKEEKFQNIVVSMKSSNVLIMVQSCKLLVTKMNQEGMRFPLHLGVTEAGEGEDGRVKSAIGIGALLNDGIGDTIRVSLTENPVNEIPVAKKIVSYCTNKEDHDPIFGGEEWQYNPFNFQKRETISVDSIGGNKHPIVIADFNSKQGHLEDTLDQLPDFFFIEKLDENLEYLREYKLILNYIDWLKHKEETDNFFPLLNSEQFLSNGELSNDINFVEVENKNYEDEFFSKAKSNNTVFVLLSKNKNRFTDNRAFLNTLLKKKIQIPVILKSEYKENELEDFQIKSSCDVGPLFIDGFGDGIYLKNNGNISFSQVVSTSFSILQASRARITKTEYISCPGCGRTLFELEETVQKIKQKTAHLKGLKIGIMGCIVNGPGEMADADYGYVGAGKGKVMLYKNKEVVKKNVPSETAVEELISLIKQNGDWKE